MKQYKYLALLIILLLSSCSKLLSFDQSEYKAKAISFTHNKTKCLPQQVEYFYEGNQDQLSYYKKLKANFYNLRPIEQAVLFTLFQMYIRPITSSPKNRIQISFKLKGLSPKTLSSNSIYSLLENLLKSHRSNYSLYDLIKITDRKISTLLPVSQKLNLIIIEEREKTFYNKKGKAPTEGDLFKTRKLIKSFKAYSKTSKRIPPPKNSKFYRINDKLQCNKKILHNLNNSTHAYSNTFGVSFPSGQLFIVHTYPGKEVEPASICESNKGIAISTDNISNGEIILKEASNQSRGFRSLRLESPKRIVVESLRATSVELEQVKRRQSAIYHHQSLGKIWHHNYKEVELDPRYKDTRTCR